MSRTTGLGVVLISFVALLHSAEADCSASQFTCTNGKCISENWFCDRANDCGDNSDEEYCNVDPSFRCPAGWTSCPNKSRCILSHWMCDGRTHCPDVSEASVCAKKKQMKSWLLERRKSGSRSDRWGSEVHRIAVALHLADESTFSPGNRTGEEILYELTIQLLKPRSKDKKISSQELALFIHALLVACVDPRDFYGNDLVRELRRRVEGGGNFVDPFLILALCNAGDNMTAKDVDRVTAAYDSQHRAFWTDSQALAAMALSCITTRSGVPVVNGTLDNMLQELKGRQSDNGTVENFRTTALVAQALQINDSYRTDFDMDSAIRVLYEGFNASQSLLNAYYALPVMMGKSLLDVTSAHCTEEPEEDDEIAQKLLDVHGDTIKVRFSVWMGDDVDEIRTWRVKVCVNSTVYDVIETVSKVVNGHKVEYNVVHGKPYVSAWSGKQDDPERGLFWFVYLKSGGNQKIVEESPADVKLKNNQEIILWYKRGSWNLQSMMQKFITSTEKYISTH